MASLGKIATTRKLQAFQRTLCRIAKRPTSTVHAVNDLGELDAGNPPVQFDEGWGVPGRTDNYGRLIFIRELPAYSTHEGIGLLDADPIYPLMIGIDPIQALRTEERFRALGSTRDVL